MRHSLSVACAVVLLSLSALPAKPALAQARPRPIFDPATDALCFRNFDPELSEVVPILGSHGEKTGVCQGMAALTAAFLENVDFDPEAPRADRDAAKKIVKNAVKAHRNGCAKTRVTVPGYANLREFCEDHRRVFLKQSVLTNAKIAVREIAPKLPEFHQRRKKLIDDRIGLERLHRELTETLEHLGKGRKPLLLWHSHVVLVLSASWEEIPEGGRTLHLLIEDSNREGLRELTVAYAQDGLPAAGKNRMYWDVTPKGDPSDCDE